MSLLVVLVVVAPLLLAWWLATRPVSPERVARFERRHRVAATPEVVAYLGHTRRWRAFGVAAGHVAGLITALPQQRVSASFTAMLGGWLLGAVVAEFRLAVDGGGPLPRWMRRAPVVLAGAAVGCTAIVLALGDRPLKVAAWGVGILGCAVAISVALRHIAARPSPSESSGSMAAGEQRIAAAVGRHSAGAIIGVGTALALACLGSQITAVSGGYFDATRTAVALVGTLVALGGLGIGWLLAHADRPPLWSASAYAVVLVLASAAVLGWARWRDHPPYPASAVHATATIRFTDQASFATDAASLGVAGLHPLVDTVGRQFVGRLDYRVPAGADPDTVYTVAVIDKRRNRMADWLADADGGGWNGFMSELPERYPWLSAFEAPRTPEGGYGEPGMAVSWSADRPGPSAFAGNFIDGEGLTAEDIMVVLVCTGPQNQTYWVSRLAG